MLKLWVKDGALFTHLAACGRLLREIVIMPNRLINRTTSALNGMVHLPLFSIHSHLGNEIWRNETIIKTHPNFNTQ